MIANLSNRETEVLELISQEYTTSEIARRLCVSAETVKSHRRNLLIKLDARNVAGLMRRAFELHLLSATKILIQSDRQYYLIQ